MRCHMALRPRSGSSPYAVMGSMCSLSRLPLWKGETDKINVCYEYQGGLLFTDIALLPLNLYCIVQELKGVLG